MPTVTYRLYFPFISPFFFLLTYVSVSVRFYSNLSPLVQHINSWRQTVTYRINYQGSTTPLTATLVWYDPPAVEGSTARSLISDLDLCAISPGNAVTCGNTRSSNADRVNNNEKLLITNPQTGVWQVTVKANALPYGSGQQYFSIVITSQGGVTRSG